MTATIDRTAIPQSPPMAPSPSGADSLNGQRAGVAHGGSAVEGSDLPARQISRGDHTFPAGGDHDSATTSVASVSKGDASLPADSAARAKVASLPMHAPPGLADPTLALLADVLDDLEKTRIANENRLRALTRNEADSDGEVRGFGLDESHPDVARLAGIVDGIAKLEHQATLNLQRVMRNHPLGAWVKATKGVGEKQGARLLAAIGDPYVRPEIVREDGTVEPVRPRTVSELWALCGYKPGQKRRRGERSNWSSVAKARAFLIAEAMLKAGNREIYDARKASTEGRLHAEECLRCGPKGKPAQPGSPWSDGHRHTDALRVVAKKAVLMGLWREAKRLHEQGSSHSSPDTHVARAAASDLGDGHDTSGYQYPSAVADQT